ncbi:ABC transporter permease [Acetobacter conturbans]|uniref:ABC transporter permease n=1 Tax=Acetobacter conturbans TaxID=1737472 RepID=A0ABX0JVJ3_9PROT|nr:ABC transporter permease [Acetobacter conturbans]NHN87526.1 ABC transporter permease [Acetobacter conturbans]
MNTSQSSGPATARSDNHDHPEWAIAPSGNEAVLQVSGDWIVDEAVPASLPDDAFKAVQGGSGSALTVDTTRIGRWDSSLVSFLWSAKQAAARTGMTFDVSQLPRGMQRLFSLLPETPQAPATPHTCIPNPFRTSGIFTLATLDEIGAVTTLGIETARTAPKGLSGHGGMRLRDLLSNIFDAGPSALIIVSVVNFLVGAILAFVGAIQLQKFSADIYVANLVGIACVRELSAVMTAIIMAGRTGGAYAARIATMLGNEEIDALQVFGIPISSYILLPAVLSLMIMMPLLYLYGCLMSIAGGYTVAVGMLPDITGAGYIHQTFYAIDLHQFEFGFMKSIVFAVMIGLTACRIGLKAGRSAADVGTAATSAVVVGIVGVIALDAIFAVIANAVGI